MIPIRYNDAIGKKKLVKICDEMLGKCNKTKIAELDDWCENNICLDGKNYKYKDVVLADYPTLERIKNLPTIQNYKNYLATLRANKQTNPLSAYLIGTLYETHVREIKDMLVEKLEIAVCPYCNRAFIDSVHDRRTYQLDHFFNKDDYPILAASFYNLVPCCYGCNYIKRKESFSYSPHNPDYLHADELTDFDIDISSMDYIRNKDHFEVVIDADPIMAQNIDILKLENLYSLHKADVQETIRRRIIYPDEYVDDVFNHYRGLFSSKDEVEHMIYGYSRGEEVYKHEPLAKMRSDIARHNYGV